MELLNKDELFSRLDKCQKEVVELKRELNSLNDKKESLFRNKETFSQKIRMLIGEIKQAKSHRDELTNQVKSSKDKRRDLNTKILKKIEEAKKLNVEKKKLMHTHEFTEDPSAIKKQIDFLEMKIQTDAPSYQEEKKIMKTIKDLKKQYEAAKSVSTVFEQTNTLSKEIDNLKRKADETHKKVQTRAKTSQEKHEELISTSEDIDELRKKEKEAMNKFIAVKKEFTTVNTLLKEKLEEMGKIKFELGNAKKVEKTKQQKKDAITLKEKEKIVQEKIRKREKLTTEDLLVMQG